MSAPEPSAESPAPAAVGLSPSGSALHDEEEVFQLPMHGLFADMELGRGVVCLPEVFHQQDASWRARVLDDWLVALEAERAALSALPLQPQS